jgi:hypothetical protein
VFLTTCSRTVSLYSSLNLRSQLSHTHTHTHTHTHKTKSKLIVLYTFIFVCLRGNVIKNVALLKSITKFSNIFLWYCTYSNTVSGELPLLLVFCSVYWLWNSLFLCKMKECEHLCALRTDLTVVWTGSGQPGRSPTP